MLKYLGSGALVFVIVAIISMAVSSEEDAGAFQDATTGSCNVVGPDPPPDPIRIGPTAMMDVVRHELVGNQAETHVHIYPVQSMPTFIVTEPMIEGVLTYDTNTADYTGTDQNATYFNPSTYTLSGQFDVDPGTGAPLAFEGVLEIDAKQGNQPNLDLQFLCTFEQPTPTPSPVTTPSPTPGPYSIVVLKLNDATNGPIANWGMELFANDDCSGDPIDEGVTNDDGIIDFVGLSEGVYSVLEEDDPNFTPDDGNLCREDIAVPGPSDTLGTNGGFIDCPVPSGEFPAAGCDSFQSGAQVNVEFVSGSDTFTVTLNGPTTIHRKTAPQDETSIGNEGFTAPSGNGAGNGLDEVTTEIIQLDLQGASQFGTITVRESSERVSNGIFEEMANPNPGTMDFQPDGAHSFFDVFIEVDVPGFGTLHNVDPVVMYCIIFEIPPLLCLYQPPIDDPIDLFDEDEQLVARLIHAAHVPVPAGEVFVVFRNIPSEDKLLIMGDWDCDEDADAVDVLAALTFLAGLTPNQAPGCPSFEDSITIALIVLLWGDTDCDGDVDSVDALKLLQFIAGFSFQQTQPCPTILDP